MKTKRFNFRVDLLTYLAIRDYAKYLDCSVTDLILNSIAGSYLVRIEQVSNVDQKFYLEMSGMANNLNQCTRALNALAKQIENGNASNAKTVFQDVNTNFEEIKVTFSKVSKATGITEKGLYSYLKSHEYGTQFSDFLEKYDPYLLDKNKKEIDAVNQWQRHEDGH